MKSNLKFERFCLSYQNVFYICFTKKSHVLFSEKKSITKVCDCFFNVAVYCKISESPYREFFNLCMNKKQDKKTSLAIMRKETCFVACCKDFLKAMVKKRLNKIRPMLASNCFYSSGIASGSEDDMMSCINTNFDEQNFDYFCFCCQRKVIDSFSNELHYITSVP